MLETIEGTKLMFAHCALGNEETFISFIPGELVKQGTFSVFIPLPYIKAGIKIYSIPHE